jgi:superfamily II DNA/RNA helicase
LIEESDVCVVSRIGDRGLSLPDLRLVIEVAGAGSAREQFAQRVGRLLHGEFEGEFITVFTPEEAAKYRGRVFGVEAELAGSVDIEFIQVGTVTAVTAARPKPVIRQRTAAVIKPVRSADEPADEIAQLLALPAVAAKLTQAKKEIGRRTAPYIERVLRYCWSVALSAKEIAEGLGIVDAATQSRMRSACNAAVKIGLMMADENGRYRVNQDELNRLKTLSELRRV